MLRSNDPDDDTQSPPTPLQPWGAPPQDPQPASPHRASATRSRVASAALVVLILGLVGARAYRDLSSPDAGSYWKDLYIAPSMTGSIIALSGDGSARLLAIRGTIGPAAAQWFRGQLDDAALSAGDTVVLSSPGGDVGQAIIIGEIIRSRRLSTKVGIVDREGHITRSYCASACVFAYAGGRTRGIVPGSQLGVHRFTLSGTGRDAVADTQRTAGIILGYMTRMGISPAVVEAMSATSDIRWLSAREAVAMKLVTDPGS